MALLFPFLENDCSFFSGLVCFHINFLLCFEVIFILSEIFFHDHFPLSPCVCCPFLIALTLPPNGILWVSIIEPVLSWSSGYLFLSNLPDAAPEPVRGFGTILFTMSSVSSCFILGEQASLATFLRTGNLLLSLLISSCCRAL